jgi:putative transposase
MGADHESIQEARNIIEDWRKEYNQERPHRSLADQTPLEFEENWRGQNALRKAA